MYKIYLKKKLVGFVVVFLIVFYYKKFNSRLLILDIKKNLIFENCGINKFMI